MIRIDRGAKQWRLQAEVKLPLTHEWLSLWYSERRDWAVPVLLVTDFVTPSLVDRLRELHTPFMDTAGNAYVNLPGFYVLVSGNKRPEFEPRPRPYRAFRPTGLRVIHALLCNPGLENKTYREIAASAGVALGTVNLVMRDLKAQGYLADAAGGNRRIRNRKELLNEWVTVYPRELRHKLVIGRYTGDSRAWWSEPTPGVEGATWGGEIAAARLTKLFIPAAATIYLHDLRDLTDLTSTRLLRKDPQGDVEVLSAFWHFGPPGGKPQTVDPILVYADLIGTGVPRTIDAARTIYRENIEPAMVGWGCAHGDYP